MRGSRRGVGGGGCLDIPLPGKFKPIVTLPKKKKLLISLTNEITCGKILLSNLFHKFQDKYLMTVLRIILRISKVCF